MILPKLTILPENIHVTTKQKKNNFSSFLNVTLSLKNYKNVLTIVSFSDVIFSLISLLTFSLQLVFTLEK